MYRVRVERKAQKELAKIPEPYYTNIKRAILALASDPRPAGCKKMKGRRAYRIRIADYRVIYEVQDAILLVNVIELGDRKDVYR